MCCLGGKSLSGEGHSWVLGLLMRCEVEKEMEKFDVFCVSFSAGT